MGRDGDKEAVRFYVERYGMDAFLSEELTEKLRLIRFEAHETILSEQTAVRYLQFLVEGEVRCAHYNANGALAVVGVLEPLDTIGDVEILSPGTPAITSLETTAPTVLLQLPQEAFLREGIEDPRLLRYLMGRLVTKLNLSTALRLGHLLPVKSRLALFLLTQPGAGQERVVIVPEKAVLASMLGTTYRHLNRVLKELIREGAVGEGYPGVRIKNEEILNRLIH